jgi:hypothetical protein
MRTPSLSHEESLYLFTLKAYRTVVTLAHSDCRILNSHLRRHALRLLEHVAASQRARGPRSRNRSLDYAKLSLAKLGAVIDAIWCEREYADEPREKVRGLLRRLELELDSASTLVATPTDSMAKAGLGTVAAETAAPDASGPPEAGSRIDESVSAPADGAVDTPTSVTEKPLESPRSDALRNPMNPASSNKRTPDEESGSEPGA